MSERPLDGGIANAGAVVRAGPHVLRPASRHTGSIHELLRAVISAGFDGAPQPIGVDHDGRERLQFIEGDVPLAPYPDWSQSDTALTSVARLLRRFHDAAIGFDSGGFAWDNTLADPSGGTAVCSGGTAVSSGGIIVCHNDVELSNVVFRDGIAVALIDFEFAAPGRPVYDLAQLARLCVPIEDDFDQDRIGWKPADRPARLRLVADAYGLDHDDRATLLGAIDDALRRVEAAARRGYGKGVARSAEILAKTGGIEKYDRRREWWNRHRGDFSAALH